MLKEHKKTQHRLSVGSMKIIIKFVLKVISQVTRLYSSIIYIRKSSTKLSLWDKVHDDDVILLYMDMCLIT